MQNIHVLDKTTIDKIAAGEVVERPRSVVKELLENAIDAGSDQITVEIKNGGIDYIRITDNGSGIDKEDIRTAFLRHATSKIQSIEDLLNVASLGFRGEALSSIASVSKVELLTKTKDDICGTRYVIEGGREMVFEDAGVPNGTTIIVKNLFYNVPARRKFLKTAMTEASYISTIMEQIMLSHPKIAFKFIANGSVKLQTNGDGEIKNVIYQLFGKDVISSMLPVQYGSETVSVYGYAGKPELARGNHNYELFFVNGRCISSTLINRALDEAYKSYLMLHKYPYAILYFDIPGEFLDVNVHPAKLEIRFLHAEEVYEAVVSAVRSALKNNELIPEEKLIEPKPERESIRTLPDLPPKRAVIPEPFEQNHISDLQLSEANPYRPVTVPPEETKGEQLSFLSEEAMRSHRLIGRLFDTYWLVEYDEKLFVIDQHAAHEKIRYERLLHHYQQHQNDSQLLNPPVIITFTIQEEETFLKYRDTFSETGFEIEPFGGREYAIRAVPTELYGIPAQEYLTELLDSLSDERTGPDLQSVLARLATISCKGAVKAGNRLSFTEAEVLLDELLSLENPYNCPHGRPVIISFSKYDIERKFKRII
ncbi:MAG: DNA mismatch repair endonuclease MutL [Lachnospiraceae bacterium]|nr:DNA mismatch repair endonuclease MutL [Lachnospiraceae bacterium]